MKKQALLDTLFKQLCVKLSPEDLARATKNDLLVLAICMSLEATIIDEPHEIKKYQVKDLIPLLKLKDLSSKQLLPYSEGDKITPIEAAITKNDVEVVQLLLAKKELSLKSENFKDPLLRTVFLLKENSTPEKNTKLNKIFKIIVDRIKETNPELLDEYYKGFTPLHRSAMQKDFLLTLQLLAAGANPELRAIKSGKTFLHILMSNNEGALDNDMLSKVIIGILKKYPNISLDAKEEYGNNYLQTAANYGYKLLVDYLLTTSLKDSINDQNNSGSTALYCSVYNGNISIAKSLLENGADPNICTFTNLTTPLHRAVFDKQIELVELLIEYDADINAENRFGGTPVLYAIDDNNLLLLEKLLQNKEVKFSIKTSDQRNLIHYIFLKNVQNEIISLVLDKLTQESNDENLAEILNTKDQDGHSPLDLALVNNHIDALKIVIKEFADNITEDNMADLLGLSIVLGKFDLLKEILNDSKFFSLQVINDIDDIFKDCDAETKQHLENIKDQTTFVRLIKILEPSANLEALAQKETQPVTDKVSYEKPESSKILVDEHEHNYQEEINWQELHKYYQKLKAARIAVTSTKLDEPQPVNVEYQWSIREGKATVYYPDDRVLKTTDEEGEEIFVFVETYASDPATDKKFLKIIAEKGFDNTRLTHSSGLKFYKSSNKEINAFVCKDNSDSRFWGNECALGKHGKKLYILSKFGKHHNIDSWTSDSKGLENVSANYSHGISSENNYDCKGLDDHHNHYETLEIPEHKVHEINYDDCNF